MIDDWQQPDLGPCCSCARVGPSVRNILMLSQKAPIAGHGWGCLLCGLPSDGAVAVVCDTCLASDAKLAYACRGYPGADGRVPIEDLTGEHVHDEAVHRADDETDRVSDGCYEGDKVECRAMSGGTSHSPCAHCGAETGCVPVLMWREAASGRDEDLEMFAVCDGCAPALLGGPITRAEGLTWSSTW